jgi:hypothetical protein
MTIDGNQKHAGREPREVLAEHVRGCGECRMTADDLGAIDAALGAVAVEVDASALSLRTLAALRPEMEALAARAFWRRVVAGILAALLPLPVVLAVDALVLRAFYALLSAVLPGTLAAFVIGGMALSALLLVAVSYAAIPLLADRQLGRSRSALA